MKSNKRTAASQTNINNPFGLSGIMPGIYTIPATINYAHNI